MEDGEGSKRWTGDVVGSPKRVRRVLNKVGARMENVTVHRGWFDDTIPGTDLGPIALLHIDCDFYAPTLLVLRQFVPQMASGGWIQIDDYQSFEGCRLAVNEFIGTRPDLSITVEPGPGGATVIRMP